MSDGFDEGILRARVGYGVIGLARYTGLGWRVRLAFATRLFAPLPFSRRHGETHVSSSI
jgi:hypothetical protein